MKLMEALSLGLILGFIIYLFAVVAVDALTRPVVLQSVSKGCLGVYEDGHLSLANDCGNLPKSYSLEYRP